MIIKPKLIDAFALQCRYAHIFGLCCYVSVKTDLWLSL